jgi:hypothetical protein
MRILCTKEMRSTTFWSAYLKGRNHLEGPNVDEMEWIHLAQDRDLWQAGSTKAGMFDQLSD